MDIDALCRRLGGEAMATEGKLQVGAEGSCRGTADEVDEGAGIHIASLYRCARDRGEVVVVLTGLGQGDEGVGGL